MKKSLLFHTIINMMDKAAWAIKYNPHQRFDVDVYWYDTLTDYLDALRQKWKDEVDQSGECDDYIDISQYDFFEDYEADANMCLEYLEWIKEVSEYGEFDANPLNYETKDDYLDTLFKKVREKYDPDNEFYNLNPLYYSPDDYQYEINERKQWREGYDPARKYPIDPCTFSVKEGYIEAVDDWKDYIAILDEETFGKPDDMGDYRYQALKQLSRRRHDSKESIEEVESVTEEDKQSWEDKYNSYNTFSSVDPSNYDHELDYLDDLRKVWKEYYDPSDIYNVNPQDYDNEEDYMEAIQKYIKSRLK